MNQQGIGPSGGDPEAADVDRLTERAAPEASEASRSAATIAARYDGSPGSGLSVLRTR
jgi:hypothetical protein